MIPLFIATFIVIVLAIILGGLIAYGSFTKNIVVRNVGFIASVVILLACPFLLPFIQHSVDDVYQKFSKATFRKEATGEVQLNFSPLRIPKGMKEEEKTNYCKTFTDQDGEPINLIVTTHYGSYCGNIPDMDNEFVLIPFKIRADGKAEYWIAAGWRTIGEAPKR